MERLKEMLHRSRAECLARGHTWDVADVMEVVRAWLLSAADWRNAA